MNNHHLNFYKILKYEGVAPCWNKPMPMNLHTKFQHSSSYSFREFRVHTDRRTNGQTWSFQEYIYFMGSETLPFACNILSDESSLTFYSIDSITQPNNLILHEIFDIFCENKLINLSKLNNFQEFSSPTFKLNFIDFLKCQLFFPLIKCFISM